LSVHSPLVNRTFDNNNSNVTSIVISKASHCVVSAYQILFFCSVK
jgi:hypothetical protein